MAKLLCTFAIVKKHCKTSLISTKLNCFDLNPNIKISSYPIMRLALTFLYRLSSPKYPNNWGRIYNYCGGVLAYIGENNISKTNSWLLNLIYFNIKPNLKLLYIYIYACYSRSYTNLVHQNPTKIEGGDEILVKNLWRTFDLMKKKLQNLTHND